MTRGILFLGAPHSGTGSAFVASLLSCTAYWRGSSPTLLEYMAPDSEHLNSLEKRFHSIYAHSQSHPTPLPYICDFQEMRPERIWRFALKPTVDRRSGRSFHGEVVKLDTDHRGLNKFRSSEDPSFRRFSTEFAKAFQAAIRAEKTFKRNGEFIRVPDYLDTNSGEYNIPFQLDIFRNDKFTGRVDILERIHQSLGHYKKHGSPNVVVLQGMGGIGKTELAVEYAHLHQDSYSSIFWIDCATENSVRRSFLRVANRVFRHYVQSALEPATPDTVATRLGVKGPFDEKGSNSNSDERTSEAVEAMKKWFGEEQNKEWLLVFDNLDDLEAVHITDYIPRTTGGSILITSRRRGFSSYGTPIEVPEMKVEEGLQFLASISGLRRDHTPNERQLAFKLLELLEYFPLAIEQAGAYLSLRISDEPESYSLALKDYLVSYQRNAKMVLQYKRSSAAWSSRNDTIMTTWEVSFDAIKKESRAAYELLLLCGFLAGSDIFEEIFSLGHKLPTNDTTFSEIASKLSSYSLVRFRCAHDAFSIHPLVQVWARERLSWDMQQRLAEDAVQLLYRAIHFKLEHEPCYYEYFETRIIPHLDRAIEIMHKFLGSSTARSSFLPPWNSVRQTTMSTWYDLIEGWYLWGYGIVSDIHMFCRGYLVSGYGPIRKWKLAYELGTVYRNQGLYQNAEKMYRWAFDEAQKNLHVEHPKTLEIAGDLADIMYSQGRYDDASDWYNWLLASRRKVLGNEHHSTLGATKGLARISVARGDIDTALRLYLEAFAGRRKRLGNYDILTLNVLEDIVALFDKQERLDSEASYWRQQLISGLQRKLGENHHKTLSAQFKTADLLTEHGRYDEALSLYERVLDGRQKTLGTKDEKTIITLENIVRVLESQGKHCEASNRRQLLLSELQRMFGKSHERTRIVWYNTATLFFNLGKYDEALSWYGRTLAEQQETLGERHKSTLYTMGRIARVLGNQGKYDEALCLFQRTLAAQQEVLGEKHKDTLETMHDIATILEDQGKYDEALDWYQQTRAGQRETLGDKHEDTLHTMYHIATVLQNHGYYDEALCLYQQILAAQQETLGKKHRDTLYAVYRIAGVLNDQDKYDESLNWYQQTLTGQQETLGEKHRHTLHTMYEMAFVFKNQGRYREALSLQQRALAWQQEALGEEDEDTQRTARQIAHIQSIIDEAVGPGFVNDGDTSETVVVTIVYVSVESGV
ncbi:hypothetical protein F4679DRAFT_556899 [Xylaria curta]|nr:hypothetical protein F4679DRAFT_556899 [Xylaria curta]